MPGSTRPARVSCHVYTIRWITVIVDTTAITHSTGPMRVNSPPIISSTSRSGRSINPTLHNGISDSARARA